jgi:hypothetical protein
MKTKYTILVAVAVCFLIMAFPSISGATPVLKISSGAIEITVVDGDALDSNPMEGMVTYLGSIGSWFNVTTGTADLGTNSVPIFDLNSISISNSLTVPDDLVLMFSDTGFAGNDLPRQFDATIGGTTNGTLNYKTYYGEGLFDLSNQVADLTFSTNPFSGAGSITAIPGQTFSMTQIITISHPAGFNSASSFNGMLSDPEPTPEPSSLILLGSGLLGTALFFRRKY